LYTRIRFLKFKTTGGFGVCRVNTNFCFRSFVGLAIGSNTAAVTTFAMEIVPITDRAFAMFIINIW